MHHPYWHTWHLQALCSHYSANVQTTLVNFCVTEKGLEDQLLAQVVEHERPDLQEQAQNLVKQLGQFTITLKGLEDNLLTRLANSQGDILEDIELIENLEETKRTAVRNICFCSQTSCACSGGTLARRNAMHPDARCERAAAIACSTRCAGCGFV